MELPSPSTQQGDQFETYCPPRLDYSVQAQVFPPTEQLDCTVQVKGAAEANRGKALFFTLRSKTALCSYIRNGEPFVINILKVFRHFVLSSGTIIFLD